MEKITYSAQHLVSVVQKHLMPQLTSKHIFTLTGPMGSGKTTLVKAFLHACGVEKTVTSPTFSYVNTYQTETRVFHHFDLYRLDSLEAFISAGFNDYLYEKNAICIIEWPAIILPLLTEKELAAGMCTIQLLYNSENATTRMMQIS